MATKERFEEQIKKLQSDLADYKRDYESLASSLDDSENSYSKLINDYREMRLINSRYLQIIENLSEK